MQLPVCLLLLASVASADNYWWKYASADCKLDDVAPEPACGRENANNIPALEACCRATEGCGGFNSNGYLKKADCLTHRNQQSDCDLYILQDHPQPPPLDALPLVPLPSHYTLGSESRPLAAAFAFAGAGAAVPTLTAACARFRAMIFRGVPPPTAPTAQLATGDELLGLSITVANASEAPPQLGVDESYELTLPSGNSSSSSNYATLRAATVYGALHGLQTFAQLVGFDFERGTPVARGVPAAVRDAPRFPHRGLMLDTARHYYPPAALRSLFEAMGAAKLNVFHWHLSDKQSFPLVVPGTNLSRAGAWSAAQRYGAADVAALVEFARQRAIRVVPEFDMPGHTVPSWCAGHPEVCVAAAPNASGGDGALDPSSQQTFDLIDKVLAHAAALFPGEWVHLGGDEVDLAAWQADPAVRAYLLASHPGLDAQAAAEAEAYGVFANKVGAIARRHGKRVTHWEDVFDFAAGGAARGVCGGVSPALRNDTIVQIFRKGWSPADPKPGNVCGSNGAVTTQHAVRAGYMTVWGPPGSWYLSCYSDACGGDGGGAGFEPWTEVYAAEPFYNAAPLVNISDPAEQALVLGGEVTVWSERLDPATFLATAFPRAAAAAERLWSPRAVDIVAETAAARPRLEAWRWLVLERGLGVSTLDNGNEASKNGLPSRPAGPGAGM